MDAAEEPRNEQARLWNGVGGQAWVERQAVLDQTFKPLEDLLLEVLAAGPADRVLDVGCGTGSTTLAIARLIGAQGSGERGHCVGIDISAPMIAAAQARAAQAGLPAHFVRADAQRHGFAPAGFDAIVSRIGVMFFDDPVQAFANLRRAARADAALHFIAWRQAEENPFMTTAERAAAPLLPDLPARRPEGPGQFAFAEEARVRRVLRDSGWAEIEIRPVDLACSLPETELAGLFTRLGPLGQVLHEADESTRRRVIERVRAAFEPFVQGTEVRYTAACWLIGAKAPAPSAKPQGAGDA